MSAMFGVMRLNIRFEVWVLVSQCLQIFSKHRDICFSFSFGSLFLGLARQSCLLPASPWNPGLTLAEPIVNSSLESLVHQPEPPLSQVCLDPRVDGPMVRAWTCCLYTLCDEGVALSEGMMGTKQTWMWSKHTFTMLERLWQSIFEVLWVMFSLDG